MNLSPELLKAPCVNPSRASLRWSVVSGLMDETLTDILCQGEGAEGVMGPWGWDGERGAD